MRETNGRFAKGHSGNMSGRPKEIAEVRDLAREHTEQAIEGLAAIAKDKDAPAASRVAAWTALLDRGWGRALQRYEDVDNSDLLAALRLAAGRRAEPERLEHGPAEDAECEAPH